MKALLRHIRFRLKKLLLPREGSYRTYRGNRCYYGFTGRVEHHDNADGYMLVADDGATLTCIKPWYWLQLNWAYLLVTCILLGLILETLNS